MRMRMSEMTTNIMFAVSTILQLLVLMAQFALISHCENNFASVYLGKHANETRMLCLLLLWQKDILIGSELRRGGVQKCFNFQTLV